MEGRRDAREVGVGVRETRRGGMSGGSMMVGVRKGVGIGTETEIGIGIGIEIGVGMEIGGGIGR